MRHDKDIPLLFTEFIIQSVTLKAVQFLLLRWKWTEIFYELKSIEHIFYKWSEHTHQKTCTNLHMTSLCACEAANWLNIAARIAMKIQ